MQWYTNDERMTLADGENGRLSKWLHDGTFVHRSVSMGG